METEEVKKCIDVNITRFTISVINKSLFIMRIMSKYILNFEYSFNRCKFREANRTFYDNNNEEEVNKRLPTVVYCMYEVSHYFNTKEECLEH